MAWPWVSRARYDRACHARDDAQRQALDATRVGHQRFDALLDKYHALKLAGAAPPDPSYQRVEPDPPDPVTQAMIAKARGSRILLKQFSEYVTEQRTLGITDEEITAAIYAGLSDDEGVPG